MFVNSIHVNKMCGDFRSLYVTDKINKLYVSLMAISHVKRIEKSSARLINYFRGSSQISLYFLSIVPKVNNLKVNKCLVRPQFFLQTMWVQWSIHLIFISMHESGVHSVRHSCQIVLVCWSYVTTWLKGKTTWLKGKLRCCQMGDVGNAI